MINPKNLPLFSFVFITTLLVLFQTACSDTGEEETLSPIDNVSNITVQDNGNSGNASDIEVNFRKQTETTEIREYRVFLSKTNNAASFDIKVAQNSIAYESALPEDIFPVQGLALTSDFVDTDGDKIIEQESYIAVSYTHLTLPTNREV